MELDFKVAADYLTTLVNHPKTPDEVQDKENIFYKWDSSHPYSSDVYAASLEKDPTMDFVILNFADIQCHDGEAFSEIGEFAEETMGKLIAQTKPDLITFTGDNAFDPFAYLRLIRFIDAYNIPWAAVMGNADHKGIVSEFWAAYQMAQAKNSLFDYGPENMGYGNYIINIKENGKTIHTVFMMDTHYKDETQGERRDHLWDNQIEWYKWTVNGIAAQAGYVVPSTAIMHIPVPEYQDAWYSIYDKDTKTLAPEYKDLPFNKVHEAFCTPKFNNGFFALCKELGSTKTIVCGHDHTNCFAIPYEGITLTYAMKTGCGCYWEQETNGGTTLAVSSDGQAKVSFHYIDPAKSKVKKFALDYYNINLYKRKED